MRPFGDLVRASCRLCAAVAGGRWQMAVVIGPAGPADFFADVAPPIRALPMTPRGGSSGSDELRFEQLNLNGGLRTIGQLHRDQLPHVARAAQVTENGLHRSDSRS